MKLPHWVLVAASFAVVVLTWVLAEQAKGDFALPAQLLAGVGTALKLVETVVGLTTDSVQTEGAKSRALAVATKPLAAFVLLASVMVSLVACDTLKAALPELTAIENVIVADLTANDNDGQIASDVCKALGGTAMTDAVCANVTNIVADVVQSQLESGALAKARPALVPPATALLGRVKLAQSTRAVFGSP